MIQLQLKKTLQGSLGEMPLDVDLKIKEHDFVALGGKSGSGKTTLLRIIAGLEEAKGEIIISNEIWQNQKFFLPTQKRKIGFVFQDYALFENMSVLQNLLFVAKDRALAMHLLELTELTELQNRLPRLLSGGQKQRVALCRAFMRRPKILLLDEPLSALDLEMRNKLQQDILHLHREFQTTTIMVSHDPSEIYRLANRVVLLSQGKIIQDGTPKEVLLQIKGSQKFSLKGELLEIIKADVLFIGIVSIGQNIVEVVMDEKEAKSFQVGQSVHVNTKAFAPSLSF